LAATVPAKIRVSLAVPLVTVATVLPPEVVEDSVAPAPNGVMLTTSPA
jgi:hypothetical protein